MFNCQFSLKCSPLQRLMSVWRLAAAILALLASRYDCCWWKPRPPSGNISIGRTMGVGNLTGMPGTSPLHEIDFRCDSPALHDAVYFCFSADNVDNLLVLERNRYRFHIEYIVSITVLTGNYTFVYINYTRFYRKCWEGRKMWYAISEFP